jgi:hypothetical protein
MQKALIPTPVDGFQIEKLDGEIVLLHPLRNIIIHGNQTGAFVWQLCDGVRSMDEIVEILSAAYPEADDEIRADVPAVIQTLLSRGALRSK